MNRNIENCIQKTWYHSVEAECKEATPTAWLSGRVFSLKVSEHKLIMLSKSTQP